MQSKSTYENVSNSNDGSRGTSKLRGEPSEELKQRLAERLKRIVLPRRVDDLKKVVAVVQGRDPNFGESIAEGGGELLLTVIASRVHRSKDLKAFRGNDRHLLDVATTLLGKYERPGGLEHRIESFENGVVGKRDFIEENKVTRLHSLDEWTIVPFKERGRTLETRDDVAESRSGLRGRGERQRTESGLGGKNSLLEILLIISDIKRDVQAGEEGFEFVDELGLARGSVSDGLLATEKIGCFHVLMTVNGKELLAKRFRQ